MNNVNFSTTRSSYDLLVDRHGRIKNRVVREAPPGKWNVKLPFQNEDALIPASRLSPSIAQLENLKKDVIFKMLLSEEEYKEEVAIPFLRAFWGHRTEIKDLTLKTTTLRGSTVDSRDVIPDTVWQSPDTGDVFLIEMQRRPQDFYNQRLSLYDGKLRATLAKKGRDWDYNQLSVFVLGMADFDLERPASDDYLYEYVSMNPKNHKDLLTNRDWKMLADLRKAKRIKPETYTEKDKWIYLLNNFHKLKEIPEFLKEGYFDKVIEIAKNLNRTKMEELTDFFWENYQMDLAREAKAEGLEEGEAKGKAKGLEEGEANGKAKGLEEGEANGMNMVIKSFILNNPNCGVQEAAAILGVDEQIVKPLFSTTT